MTPCDYDQIRENLMLSKTSKNKTFKFSEVQSCKKCDNMFNTKPALHEHNTIYHTEISQKQPKVQSDSHCEERFNTTLSLGDHIDRVHMDTLDMETLVCKSAYPCIPTIKAPENMYEEVGEDNI